MTQKYEPIKQKNECTSSEIINKIRTELVEKTYYDDVKYNIRSKSRWGKMADITSTLSQIMIGAASITAFSSGFFDNPWPPFLAGCFSTMSLVLIQFSSYATKESKDRTQQVNRILDRLGIEEIVDTTIDYNNSFNNTVNNVNSVTKINSYETSSNPLTEV